MHQCDVEPAEQTALPSLGQFCKENQFCAYYLTSAKENINVAESLHYLVEQVESTQIHAKCQTNEFLFQIVKNKEITENLLKRNTMSREIIIEKKPSIIGKCC